jgi:pyruvate/2-oxoglutarate dehydrogenase complex dihydrolipoamide acyltransferase (E2) component
MADVTIPEDLWDEDLEGAISVWFFEDGDGVNEGDTLCEVMVEKSTFEILAPASGTLTIAIEVEVPLNKGDTIARIG